MSARKGFLLRWAILPLFFLSGSSGLFYEITWMRRLTHVFGSTTLAISTVLAAFMGGLALGSFLGGRWADRHPRRVLPAYGILEIGIALLALAIPQLFRMVEFFYLRLYPSLEATPGLFFLLQFLLVALVIILPTSFMGATLPLLSKTLLASGEEIRFGLGNLYASNTLGAGVGVALATYWFMPRLGVLRSELVAVSVNLVVGASALLLARSLRARPFGSESEARDEPSIPPGGAIPATAKGLLAATALIGFAAMASEVVWSRVLAMVIGSSVYSFGMMLIVFLLGLSLGSALFARLRLPSGSEVTVLVLIGAGLTGTILIGIGLVPKLPVLGVWFHPLVSDSFWLQQLLNLVVTALLLLPSAVLFGMAFPAVIAAITDSLASVGRRDCKVL